MARLSKRVEALDKVASATQNLSVQVQREAVKALLGAPSRAVRDILWMVFVPGLLVLAVVLAVFVYLLIDDAKATTDPAVLVSALTFVLGALVGLFAPTPGRAKEGEEGEA